MPQSQCHQVKDYQCFNPKPPSHLLCFMTHQTFAGTIPQPRTLLGLHPAAGEYLSTLDVPELLKLVYRDHIVLKHAGRKRLASEMESKLKEIERPQSSNQALASATDEAKRIHVLSKALVRYLTTVSWLFSLYCLNVLFCFRIHDSKFPNVLRQTATMI